MSKSKKPLKSIDDLSDDTESPPKIEDPLFYFKLKTIDKREIIYSINHSSIIFVPKLKILANGGKKRMGRNSNTAIKKANSPENAVVLKSEVVSDNNLLNSKYLICTEPIINKVIEYINIWKGDFKGANYLRMKTLKRGDITKILNPQDLKLIDAYVNETIAAMNIKFETPTQEKIYRIATLNSFIRTCDELDLKCLSIKLKTYCAAIVSACSFVDYNIVKDTPMFNKMREELTKIDELSDSDGV